MKHVLLDTDVLLDYLEARLPFGKDALQIISHIMSGRLVGYVTPVIVANCHYILRKKLSSPIAREQLDFLLHFLQVLPLDKTMIHAALRSLFTDFEDALQHEAALQSGQVDIILTRNLKDYKNAVIPVLSPDAFLAAWLQA